MGDVIPRFLVYLEKYVQGLSAKCKEFDDREHIDLLRSEMEATFRLHTKRSEESREQDLDEKNDMNRKTVNIYQMQDNSKKDFDCFRKRAVEFKDSA